MPAEVSATSSSRRKRSQRLAGTTLAGALIAGGLLASLGAGYTVAHNSFADGSAYVAKGNTVEHVNGESRQVDAISPAALAKTGQKLDVVQLGGGQLGVYNEDTKTVTTVDPSTMAPRSTLPTKRTSAGSGGSGADSGAVQMIASGDGGWLVDTAGGQATLMKRGVPARVVQLHTRVTDAAAGPGGSLIVLTGAGDLTRVAPDGSTHVTKFGAGSAAALTRAGSHTFLVNGDGAVVQVDGDTPRRLSAVSGVTPGPDGQVLVGSVQGAGSHVLVVAGDSLATVDPTDGTSSTVALHSGSADLGRPVELGDRAYVPDWEHHRLLVVDEATGAVQAPLAVPGTAARYALFVSGGRVWANDQYSRTMLEINSVGTTRTIDKGLGNGVQSGKSPGRNKPAPGKGSTTPRPQPGRGAPAPTVPGPTRGVPPVGGPAPAPGGGGPVAHRPVGGGTPGGGNPAAPKDPGVVIPSFPAGTNYQDACNRIQALGPSCQPVAAGADNTGNSGDVIGTSPDAGSRVPTTSQVVVRYVGQLTVPQLPNPATPRDTCAAIVGAGLTCTPQPDPAPATSPQQFGIVTAENPPAGTEVDKGTAVTVVFPDTFVMPDESGQPGSDSCSTLQSFVLDLPDNVTKAPSCTAAPGKPARPNSNANKVYQQDPTAGTPQQADAKITLTMYSGTAQLPDFKGQSAQQALAACNQSFQCTVADGDPPVGHTQDIGTVESQSHPAGSYPTDTAITLVQWRGNNVVPDVTGQPIAQACQTIANAGFNCDPNSAHPFTPTYQVANPAGNPQNPPGGSTQPLGSTVVVPNTPWQPIPLIVYQATSGDNVYVVRLQGQAVPAGYGLNPVRLGMAYVLNSGIPVGAWQPVEDFCTASVNACNQHDPNHMFTRTPIATVQGFDGPSWQFGGGIADLIAPNGPNSCAAGQSPVYRAWKFSADRKTHTYFVTTNPNLGWTDTEFIGCVWQ